MTLPGWDRNRKCRPSGRKSGHRCEVSLSDAESFVTAVGWPPEEETRARAPVASGANTITPSRFHVPPSPAGASQSVCDGPPDTSILLSLPCAKKAMDLLSGDQNGRTAPSVPVKGRASGASSERTQ